MIKSIGNKALKRWWERGDQSRINPVHFPKIRRAMLALDAASQPTDMNLPGYGFHGLSGDLKGFYAVKVTGNWRVIFRFDGGDAIDVDYLDYHGK
jgi:proteic killer suppression protein